MTSVFSKLSPTAPAPCWARWARAVLGWTVLAGLGLGSSACGPRIGDPCENSVECAPQTLDRYCDASYIVDGHGECTIWGCASGGCPDEAVCVTVFNTTHATQRCDPTASAPGCTQDELCLPDGVCADIRMGRSSCRLGCGSDADCRGGYRCVPAGAGGLYVSPKPGDTSWLGTGASVCVPLPGPTVSLPPTQ